MRALLRNSLFAAALLSAATGVCDPAADGGIRIDLAAPEAEQHLGFGWSRAERAGGRDFRWITHLEADVWFDLEHAADMQIEMMAAPLHLFWRRQLIGLYVNGKPVHEWTCPEAPMFSAYSARLPADVLKKGRNRLILRMAYRIRVPPDSRELALAVERILIRSAGQTPD